MRRGRASGTAVVRRLQQRRLRHAARARGIGLQSSSLSHKRRSGAASALRRAVRRRVEDAPVQHPRRRSAASSQGLEGIFQSTQRLLQIQLVAKQLDCEH